MRATGGAIPPGYRAANAAEHDLRRRTQDRIVAMLRGDIRHRSVFRQSIIMPCG